MKVNNTPVRTSKNFGINNFEIDELMIPKKIGEFDNYTISGDAHEFEITDKTENTSLTYGLGEKLEKEV